MYISQLELQGFKSFANKTKITFDDGVTAIVGPNGCGKSNIVDALRWVLGEQRPTLLRSSSMSNVIFNGTAQKKALGMAEVSLTFVNNRGVLPTEYNEVTISRRLYRSGDSEYLINNTACRLKDIMELFMDTGMGSDAYSVIELKMVDEILQDKNNDRRRLFEEAAGVTKYKEKRKKTFRKLKEARKDLQRVDDLLVEIRKNVRSLERQASKAKKAKEYEKELKELDLALNKHEYQKVHKDLKPIIERLEETEKEKKEIKNNLEEQEEKETKARQELAAMEKKESGLQRKVNQVSNSLQEAQTELKITKERISNAREVISQHEKEMNQLEEDHEDLEELLETTKELHEQAAKESETASKNLEGARQQYKELQQKYQEKREALSECNSKHQEIQKEISSVRNSRIKIDSRLESLDEELGRINEEITELEDNINRLQQKRVETKEAVDEKQELLDQTERQLEDARRQREELQEQEQGRKDDIRAITSKIDALESEIDLLEDISKSHDTFPEAIQYLLENHEKEISGLKVLSDVLETDESLAVALESVLGPAANYLIVDSRDDACRAAQLLKEYDKGKATFIPLDEIPDQPKPDKNAIATEVTCGSRYESLKNLLLGQTLLADDVSAAYDKALSGSTTAVTREGEVVTPNGFLISGSQGKNVGLRVGLKDKIQKLDEKISEQEKRKREAENALITTQDNLKALNIQGLSSQLKAREQEVKKAEQELHSIENRIQIYQKNKKGLRKQKEQKNADIEKLKNEQEQINPRQQKLRGKLEEISQKREQLQEEIEEIESERVIAQNRYNDAQLKHQDLANKVSNYEKDISRAEKGIKQINSRMDDRKKKARESRQQIETYGNNIEELEEKTARLNRERAEYTEKLKAQKDTCSQQRGVINKIEENLKELRNQKDTNVDLHHSLSMAQNELELKAKTISDNIWEQYELLMDQIDKNLPGDISAEDARKRIKYLKQKLQSIGETNPLAIEEYEEEKERLDFYEDQIADLNDAEEKLVTTIKEINRTATKRFDEVFEKIRTNFKDVFQTLFHEDDYCDLVIDEDAEDPLEAKIEIKAKPKGKRPSNINQLSGGEKTLTAIALLFAIYLVKPSPFCVLDEVDAPLDDANVERFSKLLKRFSDFTQFIIITHNKKTMSKAQMMYGVTMPETGVSNLVGVKLEDVAEFDIE